MADFKLPDLGEGVTEAEIDRWLVKEGQEINEDDPLVEVITDKATAEIPSPFEGVVTRIHVGEGEVVSVGTTLVTIGEEAETGGDGAATGATGVPSVEATRSARVVTPSVAVSSTGPAPPAPPTAPASDGGAVKAMPPVRKLAQSLGIDLTTVRGTGPGGRITREDVESQAPEASAAAEPIRRDPRTGLAEPAGAERREPLRGVRRKIAERMTHAHHTIPPVTHVEECDVTELDATRKLANERAEAGGVKLTFLPFIVKAVVAALKDYPALNASLDEDRGEIVYHGDYNIGVAVDTPAGLVVPVVKNADQKRLKRIAAEIEGFAKAAREGSLKTEDLQGGTFTITSPGPFGGLMATPIVMHPQSGILGVHRAIDRPVVRDGQIVIRKIMNLSVTFDHRILDGMTAARFALDLARLLEHPAVLTLGP